MLTLADLVVAAASKLASLPPPRNGQVRAVPDERTVRYYASLGLLDPPAAMRGRTALYTNRHVAQVVAIKRMQGAGKSLAEIQAVWLQLDDIALARMSGVPVSAPPAAPPATGSRDFWKRPASFPSAPAPAVAASAPVELRIELAPGSVMTIAVPEGLSITPADVRALRAAAAPLVIELARRGLTVEESR